MMALRPQSCGCDYAPLLKHNQHLRTSTPLAAHAKQARPQPTLQMALAAVPAARRMRDRARDALSDLIGGTSTPLRTLAVTALDRHYRVTAAADVDRVARTLFDALAQMNGRLLSARAWLRQGADEGFATTPYPR